MSTCNTEINRFHANWSKKSIWFLFFSGVLCAIQVGCTPFENRWRRNASIDPSQEDDWERPQVSGGASAYRSSKYSRPNANQPVAKKASNKSPQSPLASTKTPERAVYKSPTNAGESAKTDMATVTRDTKVQRRFQDTENSKQTDEPKRDASIVQTDPQDLDLNGAIEALPPNLQVVLKRQLDALEKRSQETYSLTSLKTPAESVEKKVSMRITDSDLNATVAPEPKLAANRIDAKPNVNVASVAEAASSAAIISQITQPNLSSPPRESVQSSYVQQASAAIPMIHVTGSNVNGSNLSGSPVQSSVVAASATSPVTSRPNDASLPSLTPLMSNVQWNHELAESIAKLEKQLKDSPSSDERVRISQEITLRMLYVADRKLEEAMRPIEGLTESEREYIRHQVQALYEASNPDAMPVNSRKWSLVMNSQRAATDQLAAVSNLDVKTVAFCTDVQGYGVTTKFQSNTFKPDQDLLLYCELENVAADEVKDGFETQLQGSYEIIDPNGRRIADQLLPMEKEICKNHRRDYFIVYRIYTPMQIGPGNYQLRLTVEDMKAKKFGQASLDFQIQK